MVLKGIYNIHLLLNLKQVNFEFKSVFQKSCLKLNHYLIVKNLCHKLVLSDMLRKKKEDHYDCIRLTGIKVAMHGILTHE